MKIKDLFRKIDRQIAYYEATDFYKEASKIKDINNFTVKINDKKEKEKIEEGLLYLKIYKNENEIKDYEKKFLDKYQKYLEIKLKIDVREYMNNKYCQYLYIEAWNNLEKGQDREKAFIDGRILRDIEDLIIDKTNELIAKIKSNISLDKKDKRFLEENFLTMAESSAVFKGTEEEKDIMYDIVTYFKKYPITNLNSPKNIQLSILSELSKEMIKIPIDSAIMFSVDSIYDVDGTRILGSFGYLEDKTPYIRINELDTYLLNSIEDFLKRMFTVFHELGHFIQKAEFDKYDVKHKKIINIEKVLMNNNRSFYSKYYDNFFIERDADKYAIERINKSYGKKYKDIVEKIISKKEKRIRIDEKAFFELEVAEYEKIMHKNSNQKR